LRIVALDLGAIYLQQQNYQKAKSALARAVTLAPQQADAHYQLGRLYRALGDQAAAKNEVRKAQDLHKKADETLLGKISSSPPDLNPPAKTDLQKQ
jgi:Tfp pilus assembly protein PilF